jgi:hypothetical protein
MPVVDDRHPVQEGGPAMTMVDPKREVDDPDRRR